jgi:hypothetical protein
VAASGRVEGAELGVDGLTDPVAVLGFEALERVDVGVEGVARGGQLGDLVFEASTFGVGDAPSVVLRVADDLMSFGFGVVHELLGFGFGFGDRLVGGFLGQDQGALDHVGVDGGNPTFGGGGHRGWRDRGGPHWRRAGGLRGPGLRLVSLLVEMLDRRRRPLEQLVDVVAVVAAPRLTNLDVAQLLRGHVHRSHGAQW